TAAGRVAVGAAAVAVGAAASGGGGGGGAGIGVEGQTDAALLLDPLLDLVGQVRVVPQEVASVLLTLTELVALVGVPGARLAYDALLHAEVDQAALAADPGAVEDVELGHLERRGHLVLHDLDAGPGADRVGTVLERLDPAYVQPDRGVELERLAAAGRLRAAEHHADLFPELVDEDRGGLALAQLAVDLAQGLGHEPGLEPDVAVPHLALDLRLGHQRGDRVD